MLSKRRKIDTISPQASGTVYYQIVKFIEPFYVGVFGVTDYWIRFEQQHRGSHHVHGVAWLPNSPDVEQLLSSRN